MTKIQLPGSQQPCFPEPDQQDGCFPDAPSVPRHLVCWAVEAIDGLGADPDEDEHRSGGRKGGKQRGGAGRSQRRG